MTDRASLLPHPALAGGRRRGKLLAVTGLGLCATSAVAFALAWRPLWGVLAIVVGAVSLYAALLDLEEFASFERRWRSSPVRAWCLTPRPFTLPTIRHRKLALANRPFAWTLTLANLTSALAYGVDLFTRFTNSMILVASFALTGVAVAWARRKLGTATAQIDLPPGGLRSGERGEITVRIMPRGAELSVEETSFRLRCVQARAPFVGVFPRLEVLSDEMVAAVPNSPRAHAMTTWSLTVLPPADLPASDLLAGRPVWWELAIDALGPRSAYRDVVLLPVLADAGPRAA